jgi:hypothetical protein
MPQHSQDWYDRQNAMTGQPRGARHSDQWYRTHQLSGATNVGGGQVGTGPAGVPGQNVSTGVGNAYTAPVVTPPVVPPAGLTAAELAAKEAKRQADMKARRDEWDRLNNQGIHDPDGWQSIGYQPDPVAMPSWWLDGLELGTTAPAVPLPLPPPPAPPVPPAPPLAPPPAPPPAPPATPPNALAELLAPAGSYAAQNAGFTAPANWWKDRTQQAPPPGLPAPAGSWAAQNAGFQAPANWWKDRTQQAPPPGLPAPAGSWAAQNAGFQAPANWWKDRTPQTGNL